MAICCSNRLACSCDDGGGKRANNRSQEINDDAPCCGAHMNHRYNRPTERTKGEFLHEIIRRGSAKDMPLANCTCGIMVQSTCRRCRAVRRNSPQCELKSNCTIGHCLGNCTIGHCRVQAPHVGAALPTPERTDMRCCYS